MTDQTVPSRATFIRRRRLRCRGRSAAASGDTSTRRPAPGRTRPRGPATDSRGGRHAGRKRRVSRVLAPHSHPLFERRGEAQSGSGVGSSESGPSRCRRRPPRAGRPPGNDAAV
jgi:hypothetical protein